MHRIIAGGTGFIGRHLVQHWYDNGVDITVIGRDKSKIEKCFGDKVAALTWDECDKIENIETFRSADVLVNLCGANAGAIRWNAKRKQEIIRSRVDSTKKCVEIVKACGEHAPALFNASAIGTYGMQETPREGLSPAMDEQHTIDFNTYPDFLAEVGRRWESELKPLQDSHHRCVVMRIGVVISPDGGALQKMLPPFKMGLGTVFGSGQQAFSWILLDDLIAAIDFLTIHPDMQGVVNCVAPNAVTHGEFSKTLAATLKKPCFLWQPEWMVKCLFGEMGDALLLRGQHVVPSRLTKSGFTFYHPDLKSALASCLK